MLTIPLLALFAGANALSDTHGKYDVYYVLKNKGDELKFAGSHYALSGYDEIKSYVDKYNKVNDGSKPTKALMMYSRIMDGGIEHQGQNGLNTTAARIGAEYFAWNHISLDCLSYSLSKSDRQLCLNVLKTQIIAPELDPPKVIAESNKLL